MRVFRHLCMFCVCVWLVAHPGVAQIPPGYYDGIDTSSAGALRNSIHSAIRGHDYIPYTDNAIDTWDVLEIADEFPGDASAILDFYRNAKFPKQGGGNNSYSREHLWPRSYGFPDEGSSNYPFTDCHHLVLADSDYNTARSNRPFGAANASADEFVTLNNAGRGGGTSGVYPGNSNWSLGAFTSGTWEVWSARKGDVARALLYMDVRYEGGVHPVTQVSEPDLILTNSRPSIEASSTGNNEPVAYMGLLSILLQWHVADPVDALEASRNDAVYAFQGNRNPFVDHPEWVDCVFSGNCAGLNVDSPGVPTGLAAEAGSSYVFLEWAENSEADLAGYHVYRKANGETAFTRLTDSLWVVTEFVDITAANGTMYTYAVSAMDSGGNESAISASVQATPAPPLGGILPWINEFHYDNSSDDVNEFVEIAGPAGFDLSGWAIYGYNGNGGAVYDSVELTGQIPETDSCLGVLAVDFPGLQNGSPDALALVDAQDAVMQFVSYEGTFQAVGGPAAGMTPVDVGVEESGQTAADESLQLAGTGSAYGDFTWQAPQLATRGAVNTGQVFIGGCTAGIAPEAAVVTINEQGPTSADQLAFTVVFSSEVESFDSVDDLTISGADILYSGTTISGGPQHYQVQLNGLAGDGPLTLAVNTASDVQNAQGTPLVSSDTSPVVLLDNTSPQVTELAANPSQAALGEAVLLGFTVSEPLADDPEVRVNGRPATVAAGRKSTLDYGYSYTVQESDPDGPAVISISGVDRAGNEFVYSDNGALRIGSGNPADIDESGIIDAIDVQLVINEVLGVNESDVDADVDGSGTEDAVDVQLVILAVLGR